MNYVGCKEMRNRPAMLGYPPFYMNYVGCKVSFAFLNTCWFRGFI